MNVRWTEYEIYIKQKIEVHSGIFVCFVILGGIDTIFIRLGFRLKVKGIYIPVFMPPLPLLISFFLLSRMHTNKA